MIKLYDSANLREQLGELLAEADAINALATEETRDLTDVEQSRFDEILLEIGSDGVDGKPKEGIYAQIDKAEKFERIKASAARPTSPAPATPAKVRLPAMARRRLKAFKGENAHQNAYDAGMFLKAALLRDEQASVYCAEHGLDVRQASNEGTNSAGGFLVPDIISSAIIDVMEEYGDLAAAGRQVAMTTDVLNVPKRSSGPAVQYPGEAAAITGTQKVWASVALTAVKRAVLTKISNELIGDAIIGVVDDALMEIGRQLGLRRDEELIDGDGTSTYGSVTGLENEGSIPAVTGAGNTFAELTLPNFASVIGSLPDKYHRNAIWLMSRQGFAGSAERLAWTAGGNTHDTMTSNGTGRSFMGYPVIFSDFMPAEANSATAAYFGSFLDGLIVGQRTGVELASSTDYAFNEDVLTVRGTVRYDADFHDAGATGAFAKLDLAAS